MNRVKQIRLQFDLSQADFAKRLGLSQQTLSGVENETRPLTDHTAKTICSVFGVDENWLRTGEGEPFPLPPEEDERLLQLLAELTDENTDPRKKRLIATFCQLIMDSSEEDLDALSRIFESLHSALADEKDEG